MASKTYILTPGYHYGPEGLIQIGSIIANPFQPAKPLSKLTVTPAIETVYHHNLEATCDTGRSVKLSLWANILDSAGVDMGASRSRNAVESLAVKRLETRYLAQEPVDDDPELMDRLKEPRVQAAIKSGLFGRSPVYLISGVKIARGLVVRSDRGRTTGGSLTATAPAAQAIGVDIGASIEGEKSRGKGSSFEVDDQEIVVAYQVHIIKTKRWSKEGATADIFESDAAFLHNDEITEDNDNFEVSTGEVQALAEAAREMEIGIEIEKGLRPNNGGFVCIQAREE
ncbi:carbohydrate-binding-like protein [Colletotrichum asianum]